MMGLLRRWFGPPDGPPESDEVTGDDASMAPVDRLLAEHGLQALDKQLHLQDLVGEADWLLDQDAGTITFGEKACSAQVLGTESQADSSWLWAWANPSVPPALTKNAAAMRTYGETHSIAAFTSPQVDLRESLSGETLAMIASELSGADAYYRGPYEGGAVFVMVRLPDDAPRQVQGDGLRAVRTLSYAPLSLPIGLTRQMVERFLSWIGLTLESSAGSLIGRDAAGQALTVEFDGLGRMSRVSSTFAPPP
jgi:hypothetical protein